MSRPGEDTVFQVQAVRAVRGTPTRWLLITSLWMIAVVAIIAVVAATAMGQPTAALVIGLVSGAFFAGMMC